MARYIEAEELCRRINECWETNDIDKGRLIQSVIDRVITPIVVGTPTADVVEVKHGEWIARKSIHKEEFYVCSVCKTATDDIWRYCPNCGAKMDGGKAE